MSRNKICRLCGSTIRYSEAYEAWVDVFTGSAECHRGKPHSPLIEIPRPGWGEI